MPVTPNAQGLSPGLHGMALSPGTLLPQMPLHGLHQPQASLINPAQVVTSVLETHGGVCKKAQAAMLALCWLQLLVLLLPAWWCSVGADCLLVDRG